jgi:uncharacterized protein (UPF0332 family)
MSLAADLLEQARHLVRREPRRPRQASLRRGISTAYYALFHLLIEESAAMLVKDDDLRSLVGRAFAHNEMKQASLHFAGDNLPQPVREAVAGTVPPGLRLVARTFIDLQERRHEADYKRNRRFTRGEAVSLVDTAGQAFQAWRTVRKDPAARVYLAALVLWNKWR